MMAKIRTPYAHTSLEIIKMRYGWIGHLVFIVREVLPLSFSSYIIDTINSGDEYYQQRLWLCVDDIGRLTTHHRYIRHAFRSGYYSDSSWRCVLTILGSIVEY